MRYLYELRGEFWRLPVDVELFKESEGTLLVRPSNVPLLKIQRAALTEKLNAIGRCIGAETWNVEAPSLEVHASPSDEEDPEKIVAWNPRIEPAADRLNPDAFYMVLVREGVFRSVDEADFLFRVIAKAVVHWLVNEQRPVNLGFAIVYPSPYRANWKQVLLEKDMQRFDSKIEFSDQLPPLDDYDAMRRRVHADLLDTKLIAWSEQAMHAIWSIEIEPLPLFTANAQRIEAKRKQIRRRAYGIAFGTTLRRLAPNSARLYASFLKEISAPFPAFRYRIPEKRQRVLLEARGNEVCVPSAAPRNLPVSLDAQCGDAGVIVDANS